ncbi:MAG: hypothetical protein K5857_05615 [Lachnospiraceae bacterium]|nr:hypothetical protein [Lachnospiraceae bacterium]
MVIKLADRIIEIETLYPYTVKLCKDYMAGDADAGNRPDIIISTDALDIDLEREKSAREDEVEGREIRVFPDDYLESLAVYRKISEELSAYDTFLFHGSALSVDGEGYIFTAASGTGKSTHARLWREVYGSRAVMINDDKPLIRISGESDYQPLVYGTPWDGKHRLSSNTSAPLKALCILKRGKKNEIERIDAGEAMPMLIQQAYRPADPAAMAKTLELMDRLVSRVKVYRMECNMDPEAARLSYEAMSG